MKKSVYVICFWVLIFLIIIAHQTDALYSTCQGTYTWKCDTTSTLQCTLPSLVCDGHSDCPNGADESCCKANVGDWSAFCGTDRCGVHNKALPGTRCAEAGNTFNCYTLKEGTYCTNQYDECTAEASYVCCPSGGCSDGTPWGYYSCPTTDPRIANCAYKECGSDGCGGSCGTCTNPDYPVCNEFGSCWSGTGQGCRTCSDIGASVCGTWSDNCGGEIYCGGCTTPLVCSSSTDGYCVPASEGTTDPIPPPSGETCISHSYLACYSGHPWWYDSCNNPETQQDTCTSSEKCSNGECVPFTCVDPGGSTSSVSNCCFPTFFQQVNCGGWCLGSCLTDCGCGSCPTSFICGDDDLITSCRHDNSVFPNQDVCKLATCNDDLSGYYKEKECDVSGAGYGCADGGELVNCEAGGCKYSLGSESFYQYGHAKCAPGTNPLCCNTGVISEQCNGYYDRGSISCATGYACDGTASKSAGDSCTSVGACTSDNQCSYGYTCYTSTGECMKCGDEIINGNEVCDDGINNGVDEYCKTDCSGIKTYCGDGIVQNPNDDGVDEYCGNCVDAACNIGYGCDETTRTCKACSLSVAAWDKTTGREGEAIGITVEGNKYCEGKEVTFSVWEDDAWDDEYCSTEIPGCINPTPVSIVKTTSDIGDLYLAKTTWIATWIDDKEGYETNPPEYKFKAFLTEKSSVSKESSDASKKLKITKCGDDIINGGEVCDTSKKGTCTACDMDTIVDAETCACKEYCGDTIKQDPNDDGMHEGCDGGSSCSPLCLVITSDPVCGNGIVEEGEGCDDGNTAPGDGCSADCKVIGPAICGDKILQVGEECEDGNIAPEDGCSATCTIEKYCGDGNIDHPNSFGVDEQCDDGNTASGDGCSATCQLEKAAYWSDSATGTEITSLSGEVGNLKPYLILKNSGLTEGTEVRFEIVEWNFGGKDDIRVGASALKGYTDANENVVVQWTVTEGDLEKTEGDYDKFYFYAKEIDGTIIKESHDLNLDIIICEGVIFKCNDYTIDTCEDDGCDVAKNNPAVDCSDPDIRCSCYWDGDSCEYKSEIIEADTYCGDDVIQDVQVVGYPNSDGQDEDCDIDDFKISGDWYDLIFFPGDEVCESHDSYTGGIEKVGCSELDCTFEVVDKCTPPAVVECGNGIVDQLSEDCDIDKITGKIDFAGGTCLTLGYDSGTLKCTSGCDFDKSDCETDPTDDPDSKVCGDGVVAVGMNDAGNYEECDINKDTGVIDMGDFSLCNQLSEIYVSGSLGCTGDCNYDVSVCGFAPGLTAECGDGIVNQITEECDLDTPDDYQGETCISAGFEQGGSLSCDECKIDVGSCTGERGGEDTDIGICEYKDATTDDCTDDGFIEYAWTVTWTWNSLNNYETKEACLTANEATTGCYSDSGAFRYDPKKRKDDCTPGSSGALPCPAQVQLSVFGIYQLIAAFLLIAAIYVFLILRKGKFKGKKKI